MTKIVKLHDQWMADPEYRTAYDALEDELVLAGALIEARASHELNLSAVRQALKDGEASGSADYCLSGLLEELDNEGAAPLG